MKIIVRTSLLIVIGLFALVKTASFAGQFFDNSIFSFISFLGSSYKEQGDIYVVDWVRHIRVDLTKSKEWEVNPEWSPDGKKIAFDTDRDGYFQIYIADFDNDVTNNLVQSSTIDVFPSWSSDNKYIAYLSKPVQHVNVPPLWHIKIIALDSKRIFEIPVTWDETAEEKPIWDPTSQYLAFRGYTDGYAAIYYFDMKTHRVHNVLNRPAQNWYPAWSPDGHYLSFMSQQDAGNQLYIANIDSGAVRRFSNTAKADDSLSAWSPNGKYIAVVSNYITVEIRDSRTGEVLVASPRLASRIFSMTWLPNSEALLIPVDQSNKAMSSGVYLFNIISRELQKISSEKSGNSIVSLVP